MQSVLSRNQIAIHLPESVHPMREIDPRILTALRYMNAYYAHPSLGLAHISRSAGLSPWHFSRCFHADMNIGIREYMRGIRMKHAGRLLTDSSLPIKEVAVNVGYIHLSDFYHHFKQEYRQSPSIFRRNAHRQDMALDGATKSIEDPAILSAHFN